MIVSKSKKILVMMAVTFAWSFVEANDHYFDEPITSEWNFQKKNFELEIPAGLIAAIENNVSLTFCMTMKIAKKLGPFFFPLHKKTECSTISRYAIGKNFTLKKDSSKKNITYSDLRTLFDSMLKSEKMDFELIHKKNITNRYILLRWKLQRKKLPAPILLTTFFSKEWNYDTGWKLIRKL